MKNEAYEKIEETRFILESLGLDAERSNERSALVVLSLLKLRTGDPWTEVTAPAVGTRAIMDWIRDEYGVTYAPNTRETIRRFSLHQFVDSALVQQNPDDPHRPINSPKWCYQISPEVLEVFRRYGTNDYESILKEYLQQVPGLVSQYAAVRDLRRVPVKLPNGDPVTLSPGGQNTLIRQMVEDFCPRYAPGGHVLYVGDAGVKWAVYEKEILSGLGVDIDQHGKMPDLVVYLPEKNWLFLMEAASTHGPVDGQRYSELTDLFGGSRAGLVYVSCFPSRAIMRKYLAVIAWETEAWCADHPTHLIHFNGDRFLGPHG
jgi:hypothetical protein